MLSCDAKHVAVAESVCARGAFLKSHRSHTLQSRTISRILRTAVLAGFALVKMSAFASTTIDNIDQKTGWQSCSVCAGAGGKGPPPPPSFKPGIASPPMGGKTLPFKPGGKTPPPNPLWGKQLGG